MCRWGHAFHLPRLCHRQPHQQDPSLYRCRCPQALQRDRDERLPPLVHSGRRWMRRKPYESCVAPDNLQKSCLLLWWVNRPKPGQQPGAKDKVDIWSNHSKPSNEAEFDFCFILPSLLCLVHLISTDQDLQQRQGRIHSSHISPSHHPSLDPPLCPSVLYASQVRFIWDCPGWTDSLSLFLPQPIDHHPLSGAQTIFGCSIAHRLSAA